MANYKAGDILYEFIRSAGSIPWYKDQNYIVKKINPEKNEYMIVGNKDNLPRFYTKQDLDLIFRHRWKRP